MDSTPQALTASNRPDEIGLNWFPNNYMKPNEEKCHVIIFGGMHDDIRVKIGTSVIKETKEQMLLGINIDNKLTFKSHVETLCKKTAQKLHALARIANYMETEQLAVVFGQQYLVNLVLFRTRQYGGAGVVVVS